MRRTDRFAQFDDWKTQTLEYIRFVAELKYSEEELLAKPLPVFFGILDRAEKKVEAIKAATAKKKN